MAVSRWFAALMVAAALAAPALSQPLQEQSLNLSQSQPDRPRFNFRLVEDPVFAPTAIHNSGMIAQTSVAPNASLGIGLLKAAPRRAGTGEYRYEPGARSSRKAAVSFTLKF